MSNQANGLYEFGSYRLDAAKRLLTRSGESIALAPKTFDLLLLLVTGEGRVLSKAELMSTLWADTFVEDASLSYQVASLRRALGAEGDAWIETVPKHGYRFAAAVTKTAGNGDPPDDGNFDTKSVPSDLSRPPLRRLVPWGVAVLATVAALLQGLLLKNRTLPAQPSIHFLVSPPENGEFLGLHSLSPDGRWLAFTTGRSGAPAGRLWVRRLDSTKLEPIAVSEPEVNPFWSPDSRSVGFFSGNKLMVIDPTGGSPRPICDAPGGYAQGTWSPRGVIVFHTGIRPELYGVAASGGEAKPITALDASRQEGSHSSPQFLADGKHFLFFVQSGRTENRGIYIGSLDSKRSRFLMNTDRNAVFAKSRSGSGYLLFMKGTTLMAQTFDERRFLLMGQPAPVAEGIAAMDLLFYNPAAFSTSESEILAYRQGNSDAVKELVWFDRSGRRLGTVGGRGDYRNLALSPDETRIVFSQLDPLTLTRDLWLFDLTRATPTRFTFDPGTEFNPVWSPDGSEIAFLADPRGPANIYKKLSRGVAEAEPLLESSENTFVEAWSPDRRFILYVVAGFTWALPLEGDRRPIKIFRGGRSEISPNSRWVAYESRESGPPEVYVQSFPKSDGKSQVSWSGGREPHWRKDGKELFYVEGNKLVAVEVKTDTPTLETGARKALFEMPLSATDERNRYQVAADGQRFLAVLPLEQPASSLITVVTNWAAGLNR